MLVSEVMLQQTGAARVIEPWTRFVTRWPTPGDLAVAELAELLTEWQGLGYPRRARNLRAASREIVGRFDGVVPRGLDELLSLPGVGPYTARAVRVFAFETDDGVLDTNVGRLLARWSGRRLSGPDAQRLADELVPSGRSWDWNQTMFDLAAAVCTKKDPSCRQCPCAQWCVWEGGADGSSDPADGSAGVSRTQTRFEGSDRQLRGEILRTLATRALTMPELVSALGGDEVRVDRLTSALADEGFLVAANGVYAIAE